MTVGQHCNRNLVTVAGDASITRAAQLMREYHVGSIVIIDTDANKGKPVGMLTDRDIVMEVIAEEVPVDTVTVADIMSTDLLVIEEQEDLVEATQRMADRGIRRTPVVDEFGNAIGILTVDDLLTLFSSELNIISRLFERETTIERTARSS